jgi:hypothetical protein
MKKIRRETQLAALDLVDGVVADAQLVGERAHPVGAEQPLAELAEQPNFGS